MILILLSKLKLAIKCLVVWAIASVYISCKVMIVPSRSMENEEKSLVSKFLCDILIENVPNSEPMGISPESRFRYFLMFVIGAQEYLD